MSRNRIVRKSGDAEGSVAPDMHPNVIDSEATPRVCPRNIDKRTESVCRELPRTVDGRCGDLEIHRARHGVHRDLEGVVAVGEVKAEEEVLIRETPLALGYAGLELGHG
eukprot:986733-Amorphochlora_amoeboformis.AAC.1